MCFCPDRELFCVRGKFVDDIEGTYVSCCELSVGGRAREQK